MSVLIALGLSVIVGGSTHGQCRYEVTILPAERDTIPGPYSVNESGHTAGILIDPPSDHDAFVWLGEGPLVRLPMPSGERSIANDMNARDVVVGCYSSGDGDRAFVWDGADTRRLEILPGHDWSEALAINDDGVIVGFSIDSADGARKPVAWVEGKIEDLSPSLEPLYGGTARDVSDADRVVGWYRVAQQSPDLAFSTDLRTGETVVIGTIPDGEGGQAVAVNNRGQVLVVGDDLKSGESRAFLWQSGAMTDLGLMPGHVLTSGRDLNDRGLVVGASRGEDGVFVAFAWHRGCFFDLNDFVTVENLRLESALAIAANGIIVGGARRDTGEAVGVRLTPLDVPAGDVTGDCAVTFDDLVTLLACWGPCTFCIADIDEDGTVGPEDLLIVLATFQ